MSYAYRRPEFTFQGYGSFGMPPEKSDLKTDRRTPETPRSRDGNPWTASAFAALFLCSAFLLFPAPSKAVTTILTEPPSREDPEIAYGSANNQYLLGFANRDDRRREAQRLDPMGNPFAAPVVFDPSTGIDVEEAIRDIAIAYNDTRNEFLVAWRDSDSNDDGLVDASAVFVQRIDAATGTLLMALPPRVSPNGDVVFNPSVAYNSRDDSYLVVWVNASAGEAQGALVDALGNPDSQLHRYGTVVGDPNKKGTDLAYNATDNEFLVVFESNASQGLGDIRSRYADADGKPLGSGSFSPDSDGSDGADDPRVAYGAEDNSYLVVWEDTQVGGQGAEQILGRRVLGGQAGASGENIEITPKTVASDRVAPALDYCPTRGAYLVVWENTDQRSIEGRLVLGTGTLEGGILTVADSPSDNARRKEPVVSYNGTNNEFLTVFELSRDLAEGAIEGQILSCDLGLLPAPVASVLPGSRSVQVGDPASAFATMINTAGEPALDCAIAPDTALPAGFFFQETDPLTNQPVGERDAPVDIPAGAAQTFVMVFTPTASIEPVDVRLSFGCTNTPSAAVIPGVNTLLLAADSDPVPDIIALATGEGTVAIPGSMGSAAFAVAAANVGIGGTVTATPETGAAELPLLLAICQTDPATGQCLGPPGGSVITTVGAGETPTFGVFLQGLGQIPFDPATNRVYVLFRDAMGILRGATSVAVQTL